MRSKTVKLSNQEMDILYSLYHEPFINQRILAVMSGHSMSVVHRAVRSMIRHGYLDEHVQLTAKSLEIFRNRAPRNAIILAAGFGMRMVPINLSTPKALLDVNGERLIERLIMQLQEVGINDITVVVGFMKDSFEYLKSEYGVRLVANEEYAAKNNISSLNLVRDRIENTYIMPSDIWCDRNPFRRRELNSWYMVSDLVDDNSTVRASRKRELVRVPKGCGGNEMIGISYLMGEEAKTVSQKISELAADPAYDSSFWEESLMNEDGMIVSAKVVHSADVVQINTYEQLRDLDSDSSQLRSEALTTIADQLECSTDDIVDIQVLKKGMTNRSFLFRIEEGPYAGKYIMRIPGEGTDQLINRREEAAVYAAIGGHAFCDDPLYLNPENGYKITRYIEGVRCCDPDDPEDLKVCMEKLRKFHASKLQVPHVFDLFEKINTYESFREGKPSLYADYQETKDRVFSLRPFIESHRGSMQLTHIDAVPDNFLFDPNAEGELSIQLTDWEYAGMQDCHVDVAMFCIYSMYDRPQIDRLIDLYFAPEGCSRDIRTKIYCYIAVCGLLWSNWCEFKKLQGVEFGEYSLRQYQYAKEYCRLAEQRM